MLMIVTLNFGAKHDLHLSLKLLGYELQIMDLADDSVEFVCFTGLFGHCEPVWKANNQVMVLPLHPPTPPPPSYPVHHSASYFFFMFLFIRFRSQGKLCGYQRRGCQLHIRRTGHDYIRQKKQQKMAFLSKRKAVFEATWKKNQKHKLKNKRSLK